MFKADKHEMTSPITRFENELVDLIYDHMGGGLSGEDIRRVLVARVGDDFDTTSREYLRTKDEQPSGYRSGRASNVG